MDDDTIIEVGLKVEETDFNRLRSIVELAKRFVDDSDALAKAREEGSLSDSELELAVYLDDLKDDGMLTFSGAGPVVSVQLRSEDNRISGERQLMARLIDCQAMKAYLRGGGGKKVEGVYQFYFMVIVDLSGGSEQDVMAMTRDLADALRFYVFNR